MFSAPARIIFCIVRFIHHYDLIYLNFRPRTDRVRDAFDDAEQAEEGLQRVPGEEGGI